MQIDKRGVVRKIYKIRSNGSRRRHVTFFLNFGTPFISQERLKLKTTNLACRFITRSSNEKMSNLVKGVGKGHVTYFSIFVTPPYLGNG